MNLLFWLPAIAVILHLFEEFVWPGGFLAWDRAYRSAMAASITPRFALVGNAILVAATIVAGLAGPSWSRGPSLWLILAAILGGNAVFHLNGARRTRRYSPGMLTGTLLYLPLCVGGYIFFVRSGQASLQTAAFSLVVGGSYNFWSPFLHGRLAGAGDGARPDPRKD